VAALVAEASVVAGASAEVVLVEASEEALAAVAVPLGVGNLIRPVNHFQSQLVLM